jgi:16S rRNA (guanine(966)-N(2))-methyltransferase RsmD
MIRVVGGKYKGKKLKRVPSIDVRPMPSKLKESLFSILQPSLSNAVVLDGFAGTGSVGIEALSRGAKFVIFIDESYSAVKVIKDNLKKCEAEEDARIICKEFNRSVIQLSKEEVKFDLIFLDPPYKLLDERDPLKVIKKRDVLAEGGTIILRHHFKTRYNARFHERYRKVNIGDDTLSFFR